MTYNEWRDELKNNLLTVSDTERRRVLDYYAEAYADRREAGFSEREIIEGFGAPYDAAQRILSENSDYYQEPSRNDVRNSDKERKSNTSYDETRNDEHETFYDQESKRRSGQDTKCEKKHSTGNGGCLFALLCVIFAIPIFAVVMTMFGITVGLCVAPFSMLISGIGTIGAGIGTVFSNVAIGAMTIGEGIIVMGLGLVLIPLCLKLVKLMWKLFNMFFSWLKKLCSGVKA